MRMRIGLGSYTRTFSIRPSMFASWLTPANIVFDSKKLLSLDSSTISLCLSLFPWAKFRRTKGAVKLHLLLDHDGYLPTYIHISNGKKHDVTIARKIPLSPYSIVAMDRGYNDYGLFAYRTENNIYFVTRLKKTQTTLS